MICLKSLKSVYPSWSRGLLEIKFPTYLCNSNGLKDFPDPPKEIGLN